MMRDERGYGVERGHGRADVISSSVIIRGEAELDGGVALASALDEADYPQVEVGAAGSDREDPLAGLDAPHQEAALPPHHHLGVVTWQVAMVPRVTLHALPSPQLRFQIPPELLAVFPLVASDLGQLLARQIHNW